VTPLSTIRPLQYVNAIRVQDGREPVGDQYRDRVSAHGDIPNGLADFFLRQRIKRRGRFVEHQQLRPAQEWRARSRAAAFLSEIFTRLRQSSSRARGWLSGADLRQRPGVRLPGILRPWRPGARIAGSRESIRKTAACPASRIQFVHAIFNCHLIFRRSVIKDMATLWAVEATAISPKTSCPHPTGLQTRWSRPRHAERDFAQGW